jgi:hypothetical protein
MFIKNWLSVFIVPTGAFLVAFLVACCPDVREDTADTDTTEVPEDTGVVTTPVDPGTEDTGV